MKHTFKKLLTLVLATIMLVSMLPLSASADGAQVTSEGTVEKISAQETRGGY